jgi:hypothetical protein
MPHQLDSTWIPVSLILPAEGQLVDTKVDKGAGERLEQPLHLFEGLWWHPEMDCYVNYTPTHWRPTRCNYDT